MCRQILIRQEGQATNFDQNSVTVFAESLVSQNKNLGSCKVDEIGAKSGQFMMKIGAFLGRKQARLSFILVFIKQIYLLRFFVF